MVPVVLAAIAAVALGATVIEKHFTLDCTLPGPDHKASLEPAAFKAMVTRLRETAAALGDGVKRPHPAELDTRQLVRRSWHAARSMVAGDILRESDLELKRPLGGIGPAVLSVHAVAADLATRALVRIEVSDLDLHRALRAVWPSGRTPRGPASDLLTIATRSLTNRADRR